MSTSERLAEVMRLAERAWFLTKLRARIDDGDRQSWKDRFVARCVARAAKNEHAFPASVWQRRGLGGIAPVTVIELDRGVARRVSSP